MPFMKNELKNQIAKGKTTAPPPPPPAPVGPPNTARSLYDAIVNVENAAVLPDYRTPWHGGRETAGSVEAEERFMTIRVIQWGAGVNGSALEPHTVKSR